MKLSVLSMMALLVGAPCVGRTQDLETAYQGLRDAQAKNDVAQVKTLAAETYKLAHAAEAEPAPQAADAKDEWTKRIAYAKSAEDFADYALYAVALKSPPATAVDLFAMIEAQSPKSKYLDEGYGNYLYDLSQAGATAKIPAIAEKALANFPDNPFLLRALTASGGARAKTYADRLVAAAEKRPKPEGMSDADWQKNKADWLALGYWTSGVVSGENSQYSAADKTLRAALPYIQGDNSRLAAAYFYLGVADYNLGKMTMNKAKMLEGAKYSDLCAAIPGRYQDQAYKNSLNIKTEAAKMR